ncbi:hypothetical protein EMIT0P74_140114 [Pseudomonas sp. IT-P74]
MFNKLRWRNQGENCERFWRMLSVRSANTDLPACLANPPDDFVGLFIASEKRLQARARSRWTSTMTREAWHPVVLSGSSRAGSLLQGGVGFRRGL